METKTERNLGLELARATEAAALAAGQWAGRGETLLMLPRLKRCDIF